MMIGQKQAISHENAPFTWAQVHCISLILHDYTCTSTPGEVIMNELCGAQSTSCSFDISPILLSKQNREG